jgi:ATP-dependent helicase/nuclease subunit B
MSSSHRIVTAIAARDRLNASEEFLEMVTGQEVLIVSATRMAADELARRFCLKTGGSLGIHRFSLGALAIEIASPRLALSGKSVLEGIAVDALAARAVQECRGRSDLQWFEPVATAPGFSHALASTLTELRLNNIDAELLRRVRPAGADLALLASSYEQYLSGAGLADSAEIYRTAALVVSDGQYRFQGFPLLLLDVSPRSEAQRAFVTSLANRTGAMLAVCSPRDERSVSFFQHVINTNAEDAGNSDSTALDRLREHVFSTSAPPESDIDSTLDFRSATDEARECVEIARSVHLAAELGVPFDKIAILLRNPEAYQPLVEDALRRAGIPAFFSHGSRRPNPAGRALLALLACAAEGLSASRFSEYLSLGQVPEPDEKGQPPKRDPTWVPVQGELFPELSNRLWTVDQGAVESRNAGAELRTPRHWERLLIDAAVIGGRDRWTRRIDGLEREFEKQIEELRGEDEPRLARVERQRERLRHLRNFALPLIEFLDGFPKSALWAEWLESLERLSAMALRQPEAVLSVLAELRPMASVGPVTLDEVREVLTHRLTFLRTEPTERRYGKVFVATISEAAGLVFHTVFLPGLGEDLFPKKTFEDPLLLDADRQTISNNLLLQDQRIAEERLLLHTAAAAAENKLFISYPRMNLGQGRSRGPSFYAIEVIRAVKGRVPDLQELQRLAAEASQSQPGWPSPKTPESAIDDAEYDLAIMRKLMRMPAEERRGAARYLLSANQNLQRSLQSRWHRWNSKWSDADGIVDPDSMTLEALEKHRPKRRPYSATALQHFAACPYRFLLSAIHRLESRPEAIALERLDPLTRGRLIHEIQFRVLSELQSMQLLPITPENHAEVMPIVDHVFGETTLEYQDLLAPAILRVWQHEVDSVRWDIYGWIRHLAESRDGWVPKWFELSFGMNSPPISLPDGTRVRGAIDMVEEKESALRVTDHKTGKAQPPFGFTRNGEVLQPLLYAQAAETLLDKPVVATRLFYCTQRAGYKLDEIAVTDLARTYLSKVIEIIDESLSQGFLPAAPRPDACTYCDYKIVCGPYEEIRIQRKKTDRLRLLEQLRSIP